jgi:hypothetical protein
MPTSVYSLVYSAYTIPRTLPRKAVPVDVFAGTVPNLSYWLLAIGYWLLAIGYWLLAIGGDP